MNDYKERFVKAKEIFEKRNTKKQIPELEITPKALEIQKDINRKKSLSKQMAKCYFEKNKQLLVNDILEHFIYQMQSSSDKYPFYEQYELEYENYPDELRGIYEEYFIVLLCEIIKENLIKNSPEFCRYDIEFYEQNNENSTKFKFTIRYIMYIN